jgi:hypothetical protein
LPPLLLCLLSAFLDVRCPARVVLPGLAGRYLPVIAALGGILYLEPRGYRPSQHDVIRLYPNVSAMASQSGFIACQPLQGSDKTLYGNSPVFFATKVSAATGVALHADRHPLAAP